MSLSRNSVWLALAAAACSVDARHPGLVGPDLVQIEPAQQGDVPNETSVDEQTPPLPTAIGGAPSSPGEQPGQGPTLGTSGNGPTVPGDEAAAPSEGPAQPNGCGNQTVDFDTLFALLRADLDGQDRDDRVFLRYVSLTTQTGASDCAGQLERDRSALAKAMNMLSSEAAIQQPSSINVEQTLYRIDLRDYAWNRVLAVEGTSFSDVWEAIAARNPYAIQFVGPDADAVTDGSGTAFPLMFADQLLDVASVGRLYYAIIGVDASAPVGDFIAKELSIDPATNLQNEVSMRAAATRSSTPGQRSHIVQRDALEIRRGVLWQSFELDNELGLRTQDFLGLPVAAGEAIFTLPNGMLAFLLFDRSGRIVDASDLLLDPNLGNSGALSAVSCSNCHSGGFIPVLDEGRALVFDNSVALGINQDDVERVGQLYVDPAEFARVVVQDSADYQEALQRAGVPTTGADPVGSLFLRFRRPVTLAGAAGALGVLPAELRDNLSLLDPLLSALAQGTLARDAFGSVFKISLCELSIIHDNQPEPAACDAAAAALSN